MTIHDAKALIALCADEGLKQGVLKNRGEFEELLDYLDKYFADTDKITNGSSEIPKDLEAYAQHVEDYYDVGEERGYLCTHRGDVKDAVIAGAKWQKEQMISALKNDGDLPIEFIDKFHEIDRIAFQNGQANMKEQMMKEAVEGVVCYGSKGAYIETDFLGEYNTDVYGNPGDKVRVIIVKED